MKINFTYDKSKDVWCLLNKGKSSNNSSKPTNQHKLLVEKYGDNPSEAETAYFIDEYKTLEKIDTNKYVKDFQEDWDSIAYEFHERAKSIFNISLPENITAYLTINSRCPYNIDKNFFFVSMQESQPRRVAMHELWHFYTWHGLGPEQKEELGKEKYNTLKEAITVLINVECSNLLPARMTDTGYPQHKTLREEMLTYWEADKNIENLWNHFAEKI